MRRLLLLLFFIQFVSVTTWAQTEPASYADVMSKFKKFYNNNQPDSIYKMFGPEMRKSLPLDQFKSTTTTLQAQLGSLVKTTLSSYNQPVAAYAATFQKATLTLSLSLNNQQQITGLLLNQPQPAGQKAEENVAMDASLIESPVYLKTLAGTIAGTLTMPKSAAAKIPVVLIVPGSGATDRNGNNAKANLNAFTYKLIANELGKKGIASLRYDKRLVGESSKSLKESDLHIEDYIDDATALILMLNEDQRFSKIIVLGHGEGSLVGMNASAGEPIAGFISIAGAGEPAFTALNEQMKSEPGYKADNFKTIMDSLKKGKVVDKVDPALYDLVRPSIQPYMMSLFRHDPARDIRKLKIPVLIIQGGNDFEIPTSNGDKLKKAKSDATLLVIPGMSHILKDAPADKAENKATYANAALPLKPELVTAIVEFVNKIKTP